MSLISRLFTFFEKPPRELKPRPPGWNKTLDDLSAEQRSLSGDEIRWAREYEREQLRTWARFPRNGDLYQARADTRISCIVHWRGPYSGGGEAVLPAGTRVRVSVHAHDPEPVGVYADGEQAARLEQLLVPEADRLSAKYGGFSLFLSTAALNRDFDLVTS